MKINIQIRKECMRRGISRLCHFTPSRNLAHIIAGQTGILATRHLEKQEKQIFNPTDIDRLDGFKGHICCSIEYPNVWYFSRTCSKEHLFQDWVVLLIKPHYLWQEESLFCHRNASADCGRLVQKGIDGFLRLYEERLVRARNRDIIRQRTHLPSCPTDNQAEVLIPDCVKLDDIIGLVVRDEDQAKNEVCRLRLQKLKTEISFIIAPAFFEAYKMSSAIRNGVRPNETPYRRLSCPVNQ